MVCIKHRAVSSYIQVKFNGLTGPVEYNQHGVRRKYSLEIMHLAYKSPLSKVNPFTHRSRARRSTASLERWELRCLHPRRIKQNHRLMLCENYKQKVLKVVCQRNKLKLGRNNRDFNSWVWMTYAGWNISLCRYNYMPDGTYPCVGIIICLTEHIPVSVYMSDRTYSCVGIIICLTEHIPVSV